MPFIASDHYLTSGSSQLINSWTDPVYKFDSSSFYNWEQDNLPIYDLEERDNLLYEMAGYPLSSVTGMSLCVSSCGIDNTRVFGTLSDAIDAIPNTIRFPIIIEVATSGQLGGLTLQDKVFEGSSAGLEIINRGFAKGLCGSAGVETTVNTALPAGNLSSIAKIASVDLSSTMLHTSAVCVSSSIHDADVFWTGHVRSLFLTPEWSKTTGSNKTTSISSFIKDAGTSLTFSAAAAQYNMGTANNGGSFGYQDNTTSSDMYIVDQTDASAQIYRDPFDNASPTNTRATGFVYANNLSSVVIKDCVGPIYLRGFCVDGGSSDDLTANVATGYQWTSKGFTIENSNVVVENCTAMRCKDAGLEALNSTVILNRGFIAFRNYQLSTIGATYLDTKLPTNKTPGIRAVNSNLILSSTNASATGLPIDSPFCSYRNMVGIELNNSKLGTPSQFQFGKDVSGNAVSYQYGSQTLVLQSFLNKHEGIKALNSILDTSQRVASFTNRVGISLDNSVFNVGNFSIDYNQEGGLVAQNSKINYNKDAVSTGWTANSFYPVYNFKANGQHAVLDNSRFVPTYVSGMDNAYDSFALSGNHQCQQRALGSSFIKSTLPAVLLTNGSYMDAIGSKSILPSNLADTDAYEAGYGIGGAAFRVVDQSTLRLVGTQNYATWVLGPADSTKQQRIAALYAGNSSKIEIAGPTTIAQFGINGLAEDNSTIEIGPPMEGGTVDASTFNLTDPDNHTRVQLHSTRACLVANRNSTLDIHDLGDYHASWRGKYYNDKEDYLTGNGTAATAGQSMYGTSAYTSSGAMQFYPNPYAPYGTAAGTQLRLTSQATYPATPFAAVGTTLNKFTPITSQDKSVSSASWGGMCVRAVGGSNVKVRNVMFPCGWTNTSAPYYDASVAIGDVPQGEAECSLLRIWNIADQSQLHASYLSVSDAHPLDMSGRADGTHAYYGPSAFWSSGQDGTDHNWTPLSGAPTTTPDTSSFSVLDTFGKGIYCSGSLVTYGASSFENLGPFRIYVSPDPITKFLGYVRCPAGSGEKTYYNPTVSSNNAWTGFTSMGRLMQAGLELVSGAPYQILAQGYNTSSSCSALNSQGPTYLNPSSIYKELGFDGYLGTLPGAGNRTENDASAFFYTSSVLEDSSHRILLDESAMNTFANAKNGTAGTSGRQKIVGYYKAVTDYPGEGFWNGNKGVGFRSANIFDLDREV